MKHEESERLCQNPFEQCVVYKQNNENLDVDNTVSVMVQSYADVKIRCAHICGHVSGNRERPC